MAVGQTKASLRTAIYFAPITAPGGARLHKPVHVQSKLGAERLVNDFNRSRVNYSHDSNYS